MLVQTEKRTSEPSSGPYWTNQLYGFESRTEALVALGSLGVALETFGTDDGGIKIPDYCGKGGRTVLPEDVTGFRDAVQLRGRSLLGTSPLEVEDPFLKDEDSKLLDALLIPGSDRFSLLGEINKALDGERPLIYSGTIGAISELARDVMRGSSFGMAIANKVLNIPRFTKVKLPESIVGLEHQKDVETDTGVYAHVVKATVATSKMPRY